MQKQRAPVSFWQCPVLSFLILCNSAISCEGENLCCSLFFVNSSLKSVHVRLRQNVVTHIMVELNLDVSTVEEVFLLSSFVWLLNLLSVSCTLQSHMQHVKNPSLFCYVWLIKFLLPVLTSFSCLKWYTLFSQGVVEIRSLCHIVEMSMTTGTSGLWGIWDK